MSEINSSVIIARLLSSEGFTDHLAGAITKYALGEATNGQRHRFKRNKKLFSAMVGEKLNDADKIILGKFMAVKLKMSFDVGLRIGLVAYLNMPEEDRKRFAEAVYAIDEKHSLEK